MQYSQRAFCEQPWCPWYILWNTFFVYFVGIEKNKIYAHVFLYRTCIYTIWRQKTPILYMLYVWKTFYRLVTTVCVIYDLHVIAFTLCTDRKYIHLLQFFVLSLVRRGCQWGNGEWEILIRFGTWILINQNKEWRVFHVFNDDYFCLGINYIYIYINKYMLERFFFINSRRLPIYQFTKKKYIFVICIWPNNI